MPRRRSSIKKKRGDKKRHLRNLKIRKALKGALKKFQALVVTKNIAEAKTFLNQVYSQLDKAAKKGIIHPNTANRKKSRLTRKIPVKAA